LNQSFYSDCEEKYKRALKFAGQQKREFLLDCPTVDLSQIAQAFHSTNSCPSLTPEETDAINQLFWRIYFQQ